MLRYSVAVPLAMFWLALPALPQDQSASTSQDSPFQISIDLNLVVLPVTVRDKRGGFASDLSERDFEIYEDGVKQTIRLFRHEDIPVTVGLVIDHSGSMQQKIADVVAAAEAFVQLSNPQDQMFVVNFNERVMEGLPAEVPFTNSPEQMRAAILKAPLTGQTALYDAMGEALNRLREASQQKKVLIAISDGGDNASTLTLPHVLKRADELNAIVYTIGIFAREDPDQNQGVLHKLAKETGGEAYFPAQFNAAVTICQEIARDIRHQYTLGYVSSSVKAGGHRTIRVVAKSPGKDLVVRTRGGYVAGSPEAKNEAGK